ncbi:MAG: pyruvate dehydrogenase complex dihydrolipoamide acetyltransferase [Alphaproteobacteria bacterium]
MPIDVYMPQLSPTMTEGRLSKWRKAAGDKVSAGDIIAEVETDKATMEVEATDDGVIHSLLGTAGSDIAVGTVIAVLRGEKETVAKDYIPKSKQAPKAAEAAPQAASAQPTMAVAAPVASAISAVALPMPKMNIAPAAAAKVAAPATGGRAAASPLARRMAAQKGVDVSRVAGSGPRGRVTAEDVAKAKGAGGVGEVFRSNDTAEKLTPMRKAIASRLTASKQQVPHFYLQAEVRMDALLQTRQQLNDYLDGQVKLTVNDFILKACALALRDHPAANAAWAGDSIVRFGNVDVSVAVAIDGGLITPIVFNADQKSLVHISAEVKTLVATAKKGALKPEQYEGGGFSLSNLGMYGVKNFAAIVNPPQAAILAVGGSQEQVVVEAGQMKIANVMGMTLSVDHRVIDGALGAELLASIKYYLETPSVVVL